MDSAAFGQERDGAESEARIEGDKERGESGQQRAASRKIAHCKVRIVAADFHVSRILETWK